MELAQVELAKVELGQVHSSPKGVLCFTSVKQRVQVTLINVKLHAGRRSTKAKNGALWRVDALYYVSQHQRMHFKQCSTIILLTFICQTYNTTS